ncbi:T9SS type A sorting domain-containing protein, partial [candidate division WOR-3 bacterium]|nr:T9SS type A sorting domain-containing protein [candidate division WOR-3 bacterium]
HEEIHAKVAELHEGWGIEMPEHLGEGQRRDHRHLMFSLTEEQREIVHTTISKMREAGVDHEEIHVAVTKLLEGFGIESINNPGTMSSEMEAVGSLISAWSYPNPLTREMNIAYTLNSRENVQIQIYNSLGQFVQHFEMGVQEPGSYNVIWDGTDVNGIQAASGVYLYHIEAGTQTVSKSMILLE